MFTASSFLSPFLFYEEQGQRRKEKSDGGDEPALSARTSRDTVPTVNSTESLKKSFIHFSPVAVPEILCSLFARRISTAATRPSPLHPPPAARRRAPPPPPVRGLSRGIKLSHPAICSNTKRASCKHLSLPSSRFRYRRATVAACPNTKSLVVLLSFSHHRGMLSKSVYIYPPT